MKNKISKKLIMSITSVVASFSIAPGIALLALNNANSKTLTNNQNNDQNNVNPKADNKEIIKTTRNAYNANLVSKNGPIVFWDKTISSLDWFGSKRWSLDLSTVTFGNVKPFEGIAINWRRNWVNWDIDKTNNILYILSNAKPGQGQYVVSIDINSGTAINYWQTSKKTANYDNNPQGYKGVSVLNGGKQVSVYMRAELNESKFNPVTELIDVNDTNHTTTVKNGNISNNVSSKPETSTVKGSFNWFYNFIPIGNDLNIVATYNFRTEGPGAAEGTDDLAAYMTAEIRFILCDNNMNLIPTASGWQKDRLVVKPITGVKNSQLMPQRDFYTLLDGRVVTVIYDTMVIIDGSNRNDPKISTYQLEPDKWIESWSFDTNDNLFYKARGSSEIKKLVLDKDKNGNNHTRSSYYNLSASHYDEVKNNAANFTLYNVYGYSGQIMAINSYYSKGINYVDDPKDEEAIKKQYGLVVAITNHKENTLQGDTYGLLNGDKSILKSADFDIGASVLATKLPSELRQSDITFLYDGFLTKNTEKDESGNLKYPPFTKVNINDENKTLTLALYLDQIPWFVKNNEMPKDIAPIKVQKDFTFTPELKSRFLWKSIDTDYDFKNTLPSKVTLPEIQNYAPFVSTLNSQNANIDGVSYPSTTYSISKKDDATGEIEIKAEYKYLPWEVTAKATNLKTYTDTKKYQIFSSKDTKDFVFAGKNGNTDITDVGLIPELKEIKEANVLPSDYLNKTQKEFEKFINTEKTKGYPLGKMKITAQADDSKGELTISIDPSSYDTTLQTQTKTFTGMNKKSSYSFKISDGISSFNKANYLPSEITSDMFYKNFVTATGFDESDYNLVMNPDDINGKLSVQITLSSKYSSTVIANTDFYKDGDVYVAKKTINGFMNSDTKNTQYNIVFKESTDNSLVEIQKLTPNTIKSKLADGSLVINNKKYTKPEELIELFIKSRGIKIPKDIGTYSGAKATLNTDNSKGELKFKLQLTGLNGKTAPVDFMVTINGFVQGNDVDTNDNISFKNQEKLLVDSPELFKMTASQFRDEFLKDKVGYIKKILLTDPTGGYKQAVDNNEFEVSIDVDDNQGIATIYFTFKESDKVNFDDKSALEVSYQYTGFQIV